MGHNENELKREKGGKGWQYGDFSLVQQLVVFLENSNAINTLQCQNNVLIALL